MLKFSLFIALIIAAISLTGCATKIQQGAENIRTITAQQKSECKFISLISVEQKLGPDKPGNALRKAINQVYKLGGNSLYIVSTSTDWVEGASVVGEAFLCKE